MANINIYDMADEWNDPDEVFTAIRMNVTDTDSDPESKIIDLLLNDVSMFSVGKQGNLYSAGVHNLFGTPTTDNASANNVFAASAADKIALLIQSSASPTAAIFRGEYSDGTTFWEVDADGAWVTRQKFGAIQAYIHRWYYGNNSNPAMAINYLGDLEILRGLNVGGGYFTVDQNGNALSYGNLKFVHQLGFGTSPTISTHTITGKDNGFQITVSGTPASLTPSFGVVYTTNAPQYLAIGSVSGACHCAPDAGDGLTGLIITPVGGGNFTDGEVVTVRGGGF